ncbi:enoyl-CoA hydratase-related protein [Neobacillus niacini]|uniref:enoyl-CoA hydratase/isomerase family protein n=1 Tax=Neobacillus niacini TaxID=86668 RepID=UPI000AF145CE|nr:enoyl-CoA hydratase-related protein [Neobacillus niacini]MEC1524975.1 enoyl-CoA hydratase-related protein [Neobacillus niacini]
MTFNQKVKYDVIENIAVITLNSAETLNALDSELINDLNHVLNQVENDLEVKIVVLTGKGKAFSAGGNVKSMGDRTTLETIEIMSQATKVITRITEMKKIFISVINGYAMGAGLSLALASDIILAQKNAKFGLSFINVGLVPDCGLLHFLPKIVGPWKAKELIFSGAIVTAAEAYQYGIVNRLVEEDQALSEGLDYAKKLAAGPLQAMTFVKTIIENSQYLDLNGTIQYENFAQAVLQQTTDHKEGLLAFREKRAPNFIGK